MRVPAAERRRQPARHGDRIPVYLVIPRSRTATPLGGKGMEVRSASGGAALVTRHARGARGEAAKIAAALSEIWSDNTGRRMR